MGESVLAVWNVIMDAAGIVGPVLSAGVALGTLFVESPKKKWVIGLVAILIFGLGAFQILDELDDERARDTIAVNVETVQEMSEDIKATLQEVRTITDENADRLASLLEQLSPEALEDFQQLVKRDLQIQQPNQKLSANPAEVGPLIDLASGANYIQQLRSAIPSTLIDIAYYKQANSRVDAQRLSGLLNRGDGPELRVSVNRGATGEESDILLYGQLKPSEVKYVALLLIRSGVPLRAIVPFAALDPNGEKARGRLVEVVGAPPGNLGKLLEKYKGITNFHGIASRLKTTSSMGEILPLTYDEVFYWDRKKDGLLLGRSVGSP